MIKFFMVALLCLLAACQSGSSAPKLAQAIDPGEAKLAALVSAQVAEEIRVGTAKQVKTCRQFQTDFNTAAALTGQPVELLIGLATIESGGCRKFGNHQAKGMMQIALPDGKHLQAAATALKISATSLDHEGNRLHNLVLGAVMLRDYTNRFGNVADGLEAYNQGPSKVEVGDHSDFPKYVVRVLAATRLASR